MYCACVHTYTHDTIMLIQVFHLMVDVEAVVRNYLSFTKLETYQEGTNLYQSIIEDILQTECVLSQWRAIANSIPPTYEKYSIELLKAVISLWVTVRTHAFSKGWTMQFERRYQKGTRKSLHKTCT